MGGCASKPRELIAKATGQSVPTEAPKPESQHPVVPPQEESKKDEAAVLEVAEKKNEEESAVAEKPAVSEASNVEALPKEVVEDVVVKTEEEKEVKPEDEKAKVEETPKTEETTKVDETTKTEETTKAEDDSNVVAATVSAPALASAVTQPSQAA